MPKHQHKNSVFKSEFPDGSIFYSAKEEPPGSPTASLNWVRRLKRDGKSWRLIEATLKHNGKSKNSVVCSDLSEEESQIIKCHLIRKALNSNLTVLNIREETGIELHKDNESLRRIQQYCRCNCKTRCDYEYGLNRANYLVDLAKKLP